MPRPVMIVPCTYCASIALLDTARKAAEQGYAVQYGICSAHRAEREALLFSLDTEEATY